MKAMGTCSSEFVTIHSLETTVQNDQSTILRNQPRSGLAGIWDNIVGPGMAVDETVIVLAACVIGMIFSILRLQSLGTPTMLVILGAIMGFDIIGGSVCNATTTTKSWYHRPGQTPIKHMLFVLPHLFYVLLVAEFFRGSRFDIRYAVILGLLILVCCGTILATPNGIKRPMAFFLYLAALTAMGIIFIPAHGLEWFAPALLLKLLVGHLVPDSVGRPA